MNIQYHEALASTNEYCKLLDLNTVGEFTVIWAGTQTDGIGQQGNHWDSEPGKNLTFSIILKPTFLPASEQYKLTMAVAVAVAEWTERQLNGTPVKIKWPNDIYVGDKKICGILTSCNLHGGHVSDAICGIGLNVNQTHFANWIPNPVSLKQLTGTELDNGALIASLTEHIEQAYKLLQKKDKTLKERYLSRLYRLGAASRYRVKGTPVTATIEGVDDFGRLLLKKDDSDILVCNLKEIQFIIN